MRQTTQPDLDLDTICRLIQSKQSFLITTHRLPDGDGIGCEIALHHLLKALGKTSSILNASPTPSKFSFLDVQSEIRLHESESIPKVDAILVVDTNELKMLGSLQEPILQSGAPVYFIDHHVPPGARENASYWIEEKAAASGELIFSLIEKLSVKLDPVMARALYVAIVSDTGGFRYRRTSPRTHEVVAHLIAAGVEPEKTHHDLFARESAAKLRLLGYVLEHLEVLQTGKIAVLTVPLEVRNRFGATVEDTESYVNHLAWLGGVHIGILFREETDGRVKVSLRGYGSQEVVQIAKQFGGGGHRFAAGVTLAGSLDEVRKKILPQVITTLS